MEKVSKTVYVLVIVFNYLLIYSYIYIQCIYGSKDDDLSWGLILGLRDLGPVDALAGLMYTVCWSNSNLVSLMSDLGPVTMDVAKRAIRPKSLKTPYYVENRSSR